MEWATLVIAGLDERTTLCGPIPAKAEIYDVFVNWSKGKRGRKPTWGPRLNNPVTIAQDESDPWTETDVHIYDKNLKLLAKERCVVWKSAGCERILRLVITRDPEGHLPRDGYFLCTDAVWSVEQILTTISRRWTIETMFRTVKQELKLETMQVGFERHSERQPRSSTPGPIANVERDPIASRRLIGLGFVSYSLVVVWWQAQGDAEETLRRAKERRPWYRTKRHVSIHDMFWEFRQQMMREAFPRPQVLSGVAGIPLVPRRAEEIAA